MKLTYLPALCTGITALLLSGCQTTDSSTTSLSDARVTVAYENPENFSDLKDDLQGSELGEERMQDLFRQVIVEEARNYVKDGQRLTLTFTDVDLAGDYLPSAASGNDIRVIKAIYPPRMNFRYTLTDANGAVIKEGQQRLSDLTFQYNINPILRDDEMRHDRFLFREWVRKELRQ